MVTFHKVFYVVMRILITPYFLLIKNYRWKVHKPESKTYLVLMNHTTDYDFFLCGLCFRRHMYFVASEQILRNGFGGKLVKFLADPIPRKKGDSGKDTADMIISRLKSGLNVCMNVEGNRSFSGITGWISPNNVRLLRESGAGLINFAIHGGYFVNPRWSHKQRRGRMWGVPVKEYTPEMLSRMSDDEILAAMRSDIRVDAYEDQKTKPSRYVSRNRAENLETALFICPECRKVSTMHSKGNILRCVNCGFEYYYDEFGYIEGTGEKEATFKDILSWSRWQTDYLKELLAGSEQVHEPLFSDSNLSFYSVLPGKGKELLFCGKMTLYKDGLELSNTENSLWFTIPQILRMSIFTMDTILFTTENGYYQINSDKPYSALKYLISWRILDGKDYIV